MAQAFLHCEQHVRVTARLDIDHAAGMKSGEMERGRKQVPPPQAPEDRAFHARENAGEKDRRAGIIGEIGASGYLVKRARRDAAARKTRIECVHPERYRTVLHANALDLCDARSQIFNDDCIAHSIQETR